jgi:hypothetical protein
VAFSVGMRPAFQQNPDAPRADRPHTLVDGDAAAVGLQVIVITFLLLIVLGVSRAIDNARAAGRIGWAWRSPSSDP